MGMPVLSDLELELKATDMVKMRHPVNSYVPVVERTQ